MQLTELSTEYFLGEAAASVASMVATPLITCIHKQATSKPDASL